MRDPTTLKNRLVINVTPITGTLTGGTPLISYELQMNSGSGWVSKEGGTPETYTLSTQFIVTSGVTPGETYQFRYRVLNRQGWSDFSVPSPVLAAHVPAQIPPVVTTMNAANVKIEWMVPDNGASSLLRYQVLVMKSDGTFIEDKAFCDGSNFVILARAFCEIPMQILTAVPFSLS